MNRIGPKLLFNGGILTTGTCAIFFGLLDKVEGHYPFIILSFVIRIVEALGNAAFLTASFAIIAKEFPDNVATTFASLETFFGLGLIVGPTVGGALFQVSYICKNTNPFYWRFTCMVKYGYSGLISRYQTMEQPSYNIWIFNCNI